MVVHEKFLQLVNELLPQIIDMLYIRKTVIVQFNRHDSVVAFPLFLLPLFALDDPDDPALQQLELFGCPRNKKGSEVHRIIESETYKQTMQCTDRIATAAYALLVEKPQDEQVNILRRVTELSSKLQDVVAEETPLIVSLALLTAIRTHEQAVQQRADELTTRRKP